jgi:hypothetical protein
MNFMTFCGTFVTMLLALALTACGGSTDGNQASADPSAADIAKYVVPKASCGAGDNPETALQGQVPAAMRHAGFNGFNCNLSLAGQVQGEGASWSAATFTDRAGHTCAYHSTMSPVDATGKSLTRINPGVPVIDITNPIKPIRVASLTSTAMLDPWESLRVNTSRGILAADNGANGGGGPQLDLYDINSDCRSPQLMASIDVGTGTDGGVKPGTTPVGHEGGFAPDGLTYYIGGVLSGAYYAVDITVPSRPKVIAWIAMKGLPLGPLPHGLSVSDDGTRAYFVSAGNLGVQGTAQPPLGDPKATVDNGFFVIDTSDVQARKPGAQIRLISTVPIRDGSGAQHTIPFLVKGKAYLAEVDEGGSGGLQDASANGFQAACAASLSPFPMARLFDMKDETKPVLVSELRLETHVIANCQKVLPDVVGLSIFTYGSHYCSVDNRQNATAMACSYFNSGIRVFDIRDPAAPKEIAYFNPPGTKTNSNGSGHNAFGQWYAGSPDWCSARLDFDFDNHRLTTACQDNGLLVMNFENNVWPMPESTKSTETGN